MSLSLLNYILNVDTDIDAGAIRLQLQDGDGVQLAAQQLLLSDLSAATWEGLFDTRRYVQRYASAKQSDKSSPQPTAAQLLAELGVQLGQRVLGEAIVQCLTRSQQRRSLLVQLPGRGDALAVALARVPWELARVRLDAPTLMEQNLIVRLQIQDSPENRPFDATETAELRLLLVFAETAGSRPLAMRQEREDLLQLFYQQILPRSRLQIDVLCHGVSRSRLRQQIARAQGYHILHWSGHGHLNLLELCDETGNADTISGEDLVQLFQEAGGFIPQLVFLSACLSGTVVEVKDWASLRALLRGDDWHGDDWRGDNLPSPENSKGTESSPQQAPTRELSQVLNEANGYTGTALALLRAGVPQAIAMRYEVGDDYARQLARQFYTYWLAVDNPYPPEGALAQARRDLLQHTDGLFAAVDSATPLMFGGGGQQLPRPQGRSPQLTRIRPQPQPLLPGGNRQLERPSHFVGRGTELRRLSLEWLQSPNGGVALVQGLAGLGKTAIAAETIHLWHGRFEAVLAFQAKPLPLQVDEFLRQIDRKLALYSQAYRDKSEQFPYSRVYLPPDERLVGAERYEQLRTNLLEALRDQAILLVLDNFEPNLETIAQDNLYACADPEWERLLQLLVTELSGTRSRLLVTSRHRPRSLAHPGVLWLPLGPLPMPEASLFLRTHAQLRLLLIAGEYTLLQRLLAVSRGHPLILNRLAALAPDPATLAQALTQLEGEGLHSLPDLFAAHLSPAQQEQERQYLDDVAIGAIDWLLQRLNLAERYLLWIVTLANEPVPEALLQGIWSGRSLEAELVAEQLEQMRLALSLADRLPAALKQQLAAALETEAGQALLDQLDQPTPATPAAPPPLAPLLTALHSAGLLSRDDSTQPPSYDCHDLVKERVAAWIAAHDDERAGRTPEQIWLAYGERYAADFHQLMTAGQEGAREAAVEAGRRALVYTIRARQFDRLGAFAGTLVTSTQDPTQLRSIIAELRAIADQVPSGQSRWHLRTNLADALRRSGQPDQALTLYQQAAAAAEASEHWADVGWICGNWANALGDVGQLAAAKAMRQRSAGAKQQAGSPPVQVIGSELEALRIDVLQGAAAQVLPEIGQRLETVRQWWQRQQSGERLPAAPNAVVLGRVLVSGLNIACMANLQLQQWQTCLDLLQEQEQVEQSLGEIPHQLAMTRFNQYRPLLQLGRVVAAQLLLEDCLDTFRQVGDLNAQTKVLSALAHVWHRRGDTAQSIALERQSLAVKNQLPDPTARAISHGNLSIYLYQSGQPQAAAQHQLAAIVYCRVIGSGDLQNSLHNLGNWMRRAEAAGQRYDLPRLAALLAQPEFNPLAQFLAQHSVDPAALQATLDDLIEQVRASL